MTPLSQAELNFTQRPGYEQIFLQIWNFQERLYVKCGSLVAVGFFKLIPIFLGTEEGGEMAEGLPESGSECNWCIRMPSGSSSELLYFHFISFLQNLHFINIGAFISEVRGERKMKTKCKETR